jgi:hypothetical protein
VAKQTLSSVVPPTQMSDVHIMQSTNPKVNQQIKGKNKQLNKKGKGVTYLPGHQQARERHYSDTLLSSNNIWYVT